MNEPKEWWDAYLAALTSMSGQRSSYGWDLDPSSLSARAEKIADEAMKLLGTREAARVAARQQAEDDRLNRRLAAAFDAARQNLFPTPEATVPSCVSPMGGPCIEFAPKH